VRLSAQILKNFQNVNSFQKASEWTIRLDEPNTLYFQLVDLDQDGLRYIPTGASPSVQVVFPAVNPNNVITKTATAVSTLDGSLWKVDLLSTEKPSSGNVQFILTEGGVVRRFVVMQGLIVEMFNQGGC
jgi:hypothetical protein